ncbi:transporter substrate-binding domain-containing protein [Pseudomonas fontis]|uniref:histidine kinase n=1 Tax=Pseudomonas fontis TaxID=2942633 RepID=A0ABT5NQ51_9PSED|nr:transporter substrate-binding domain-containing protein [Pseudomonas fontis]MDD0972829.1 transporter substrate-binding domain-containing protein [Pseudomonas fontis]MDD0990286.1 transporter substrate-binding domain-containing protein [Pseudomonas fontis]
MIKRSAVLLRVLILLVLGAATPAHATGEALALLGRSSAEGLHLQLSEPDRQWLKDKKVLVLGVSAPDYPPFEITNDEKTLEGLTADYVNLLGQLLKVQISIRRYPSRDDVLDALRNHEIDLLGTANDFDGGQRGIALSRAYAEDQPTVITRSGEGLRLDPALSGKKIAMLYHYLPADSVSAYYPQAEVKLYDSLLSAISAVSFGEADVYIGDSISASYLINQNYLNNVQLSDFSRLEVGNFAFAVAADNQRLLRSVNAALETIPVGERMTILRRWGGGTTGMPVQTRLQLSDAEQKWLEQHPKVRVGINRNLMPLSFFNENGRFSGISADLLSKVSLRTGLKFEAVPAASVGELQELLKDGQVDMLGAFVPNEARQANLLFTRPYLISPFVLVTRTGAREPTGLAMLSGKTLALARGSVLYEYVKSRFPDIQLVAAENTPESVRLVASGQVDAASTSLISLGYMIAHEYEGTLRINGTVGSIPARFALATPRNQPELYSILDKALLSIPPEEMDELIRRWRGDFVVESSYWVSHRSTVIKGFAVAAIALLLALLWVAYLRGMIRKREAIQRALNDQMEFMRVLVDGTPHPIYVRDRQGRLLSCNHAYLEVFGVQRDQVVGRTVLNVEALDSIPEAQHYHDDYMKVMELGLPRITDRKLTLPNRKVLTIYHWMLPYRDGAGEVVGMIAGWVDVSERQRLVEQLQVAKNQADDANRAKTTFLATMSHEIRTPMNAVLGMLELAMKKAEQGMLDQLAIQVASEAAQGMLELIGDILDVARIESGKLTLSPVRGNLAQLAQSTSRMFEGLAREKRLVLMRDIDPATDLDVLIDPLRLKQIVSNLLGNAIKFTSSGSVKLVLQRLPCANPLRLRIRLAVEDSGCGISQADQLRLAQPFSQASNNEISARAGSGLGLYISRTLCEMMGGTFELRSVLGEGTQVSVELEVAVLAAELDAFKQTPAPLKQARALRILVVDDYPANRLLLTQQLNYLGHKVVNAVDGEQGFKQWSKRGPFDVVITDCNMPVMNGYELAKAIRRAEQASAAANCKILGFTANAQSEERLRCRQAGMNDCLFKPINIQELAAQFAELALDEVQNHAIAPVEAGGIDLSNLKLSQSGDPGAVQALLESLLVSVEEDLNTLAILAVQDDRTALAGLAHRIKGGAGIVKHSALILACSRLEVECAARNNDLELANSVEQLRQCMHHFEEALLNAVQ